jgi:hypothetical protein
VSMVENDGVVSKFRKCMVGIYDPLTTFTLDVHVKRSWNVNLRVTTERSAISKS